MLTKVFEYVGKKEGEGEEPESGQTEKMETTPVKKDESA